jgi:hypothetical protein
MDYPGQYQMPRVRSGMDTAQGMPFDVGVVGDGSVAVGAAKNPDRASGGWYKLGSLMGTRSRPAKDAILASEGRLERAEGAPRRAFEARVGANGWAPRSEP